MIHTPFTEVLRDAGYTPEDGRIHIHPIEAGPADYVPAWHVIEGMRVRREREKRVTEKNEHRIDRELT